MTVEYRIRPEHVTRFLKGMRTVRRMRLGDGASDWRVFRDIDDPERFVEHFITESWAEHLRQHARVARADRDVQGRTRALHASDTPPKVSHDIAGGAQVRPMSAVDPVSAAP